MVSNRCPMTGKQVMVIFWTLQVTIARYNLLKTPLILALSAYNSKTSPLSPHFSTIFLGTRKMVRIGIIGLALSDPHFCILSRDSFNLSREYFSRWAIKTSLDRNASALLDPEVLFSRVARHLACLAFCKLQVGIFQRSVLFID